MKSRIKIKVAVITNVIPSYRLNFYEQLSAIDFIDVTVFCQGRLPGMELSLSHEGLNKLNMRTIVMPFVGLKNEALVWQFVPIQKILFGFDVYFIYGNPRVISNIFVASLLRVLGEKVVIWGQAHTAGANKLSEKIRLIWWNTFNFIFVYTDQEAAYLKKIGMRADYIIGMNNGLDQDKIEKTKVLWPTNRLKTWLTNKKLEDKILIMSCARLEKKNRFDVLLECMPTLIKCYPNLMWVVVGDGSQLSELKNRAFKLKVDSDIHWVGPVYDEEKLAPWFMSSILFIHPGALGLSLMHAYGYGLPVITHNNQKDHMPEIAAFENEYNGLYYQYNKPETLLCAIKRLLDNSELRTFMSVRAQETVLNNYNTGMMVKRFVDMVRHAYGTEMCA